MAISSVNIQKTKANSVDETKRIFEAKYLLPKEVRKENEYWDCGKSDAEVFAEQMKIAKPKGGRKPKLENSLWEAVLNLNENHKMQDVQKVTKHIEKKFNIKCTRIAIHRDEGKVLDDGTVKYNYHAHLNFCTYKDGRQNWRRQLIKRKDLSALQTKVAELLGMERGKQGSTAVRANHRELRQNYDAIMEQRQALAKVKDVKAQFKEEKQTLIDSHEATQTDYTNLRRKYKELEELARKKDLTIKALEKEVYSEKWKNKEKKPAKNKDVVVYLEKQLAEKPKEKIVENPVNRALQKELKEKEEFLSVATEKLSIAQTENSTLKAENSSLRAIVGDLTAYLSCKKDQIVEKVKNLFQKEDTAIDDEFEKMLKNPKMKISENERIEELEKQIQTAMKNQDSKLWGELEREQDKLIAQVNSHNTNKLKM